jgi:DNA-directed RNA polymerase specialized sigma24 family protein
MKKPDLYESGPSSRRFREALAGLSPLQREIIGAGLTGDDESSDEEIADRHGTSASTVRVERILARRRLHDLLFDRPNPER